MKIGIITSVWNDWAAAGRFLRETGALLEGHPQIQASIWLVDNGSTQRPANWNALAQNRLETHVLELHGHQGAERALSAALGFILCELGEECDGFVLLGCDGLDRPSDIAGLVEAATLHPGAIIAGMREKSAEPIRARLHHFIHRSLFRLCTGKSIWIDRFLFLPAPAAEAICHSSFGSSFLSVSALRLGFPRVGSPVKRGTHFEESTSRAQDSGALWGDSLAAISVFRELAFQRAFAFLAGLCALWITLVAVALGLKTFSAHSVPALLVAMPLLAFFLCLPLAAVVLLMGLHSHSLRELRLWMPALDASTLVRSVSRIKREPFGLARTNEGKR